MTNGGIFKYHPFVTGGGKLDAKPGERARLFRQCRPNEFSSFHPIGEIWDNVYKRQSGQQADRCTDLWWDRAARRPSTSS